MTEHWFLHVDLDAFFASVEQLDNPQFRGKPVIVGGKPEDKRSVVSTASYEARKFGVHSAMPTFMAYKLCPQGIFVHGRMGRYAELSYKIMNIFKDFSPDVEQMSIDEAFIDLTGTEGIFGPPEKTAFVIKERVKKETGLTVSIGLARTKYLAKMASGYKKPDGFYFVHPEEEQNFILGFPLNKIWGIGSKSLENLNHHGYYTTRDIFEREQDILEFQFGKSTAAFLTDIFHNGGDNVFKSEAKSHSISAETTFPVDITDSYTAQTELLELAQTVLFRLLKENSYSRTAMVKIRYNDFRTVSIQKTLDHDITTTDSFFEIIKELFCRKYEEGNGIRLLGVGLENICTEEKPVQQQLFNDGTEKKQAVEKAIVKLSKKHPEIKIQKARTIKILAACLFLAAGTGQKAAAWEAGTAVSQNAGDEEATAVTEQGAAALNPDTFTLQGSGSDGKHERIFNNNLKDDGSFDFSVKGWWQFKLEDSLLWSFGNNNSDGEGSSGFSFLNPVFTQTIDLAVLVSINKTWFFEAAFADEFKKNTYAVYYLGNGYLKSARLSNRGITMKNSYSADFFGYGLKGGENQAPGISLHFEDVLNKRWSGDVIFRYDMTQTASKTWYGMNSVNDQLIDPSGFIYGRSFVIPEGSGSLLYSVKDIYVENSSGSYKDKNQKKYKKLSSSDYLVIPSSSQIILASSAGGTKNGSKIPSVLVTFSSQSTPDTIVTACGSWTDSSSFCGKIQAFFNSKAEQSIELKNFACNLTTQIDGDSALVLQSSSGFSPFICAAYYDTGLSSGKDIKLIYTGTNNTADGYTIEAADDTYSGVREDFFTKNHTYAKVYIPDYVNKGFQEPQNRFPFGADMPEAYLNIQKDREIQLLLRTYYPVSDFNIGTDASAGSVLVYKNGILDSGANYDSATGIVNLSSSVSNSDKIYIVWQKDSSNYDQGTLSGGAGLIYNFTPKLSGDAAFTVSWPLTFKQKYSTQGNLKSGFAALSTGINYKGTNIKSGEKLAVSVNTQNGAGNLLVMEQTSSLPKTYYLASGAGYSTKAVPVITCSGISGSSAIELSELYNGTSADYAGEKDSGISGYKIPLKWDFTSISATNAWASVDIKLEAGNLLSKAEAFEIALKPESTLDSSYDVYLQLGIKAESSFSGEISSKIRTWKLTAADDSKVTATLDLTNKSWQKVKITLDDSDRAMLTENYDARLIVVRNTASSTEVSGNISVGPYEPYTRSIFTTADSAYTITTTVSNYSSSKGAELLGKSENYNSLIAWNASNATQGKTEITAQSYFTQADYSPYGTINLDFCLSQTSGKTSSTTLTQENGALTLILDNPSSSKSDNTALKLVIKNITKWIASDTISWTNLCVNTIDRKVSINGEELSASDYELSLNKKIIPGRMKLTIDTIQDGKLISQGKLYIDNLYYSDAAYFVTTSHNINLELEKQGKLFENAKLKLNSTQVISQNVTNKNADPQGAVNSDAEGKIVIKDVGFSADTTLSWSSESTDSQILKEAGHSIQTEKPLFSAITFEETYRFNHDDKNLKKNNQLGIDLSNIKVPLSLNYTTNASQSFNLQSQNSKAEIKFSPYIFDFSLAQETGQSINSSSLNSSSFNSDNYFTGWKDISVFEFSTGETNAYSRKAKTNGSIKAKLLDGKFTPEITSSFTGNYKNSTSGVFYDEESVRFSLPFKVKNHSYELSYSRLTGGTEKLTENPENYFEDERQLLKTQKNRDIFYNSIIFYDFFQQDMKEKLKNNFTTESEYLYYNSKYEGLWRRRLFNTPSDIFVPSQLNLAFTRDTTAATKQSDVYQIKASVFSNAMNCFGSQSLKPVFKWYQQDEIISNLTGIIKLPSDNIENLTWSLSGYSQLAFYINDYNSLRTALDGTIETNWAYSTSFTLIFAHKGSTSPVIEVAKIFSSKVSEFDYLITRKESLNVGFSKNDTVYKQSYSYTHSSDVKFLKNFTFTTALGTTFNYISNSNNTLEIKFSLGGKAEF